MRSTLILIAVCLFTILTDAQNCDCFSKFEWVKKTFEENDAGFEYALKQKGEQAYNDHNKRIADKTKSAHNISDCSNILYDWLRFFRSGHIAIKLKHQAQQIVTGPKVSDQNLDWKTLEVNIEGSQDEQEYLDYIKLLDAKEPYLEALNDSSLYLRIPSFLILCKPAIDSIIFANFDLIINTKNLIIDIRNGTGGSDESYKEILPFLYTNPIRTVGVEFLSTKLNNQRMLDFINKPEYGFSEERKKWAMESYEKLEKHLGEFVNLKDEVAFVTQYDTIYPYPKNVGIIINEKNGSTDEQFLLAAKQSKKVKLFGRTTWGVLDISNMYYVESPCGEFELGYSLSRSMRIPEFSIDDKGIQPDYYLDKGIPEHKWVNYVNDILNE